MDWPNVPIIERRMCGLSYPATRMSSRPILNSADGSTCYDARVPRKAGEYPDFAEDRTGRQARQMNGPVGVLDQHVDLAIDEQVRGVTLVALTKQVFVRADLDENATAS